MPARLTSNKCFPHVLILTKALSKQRCSEVQSVPYLVVCLLHEALHLLAVVQQAVCPCHLDCGPHCEGPIDHEALGWVMQIPQAEKVGEAAVERLCTESVYRS